MSSNIAEKVVVITGASSGLGEAAARLLSAEGASVVLGARRAQRIQALADELIGAGGKGLAITTDVTQCDQVKKLVDAAVHSYGRIDVLINNAGLMPHSPLERLKIDDWNRTIDVNNQGRAVRDCRGVALHEGAESRPFHQCFLGRRPQGRSRQRGVFGDQACRAGHFRRATPGSRISERPSSHRAR